MTRDTWYVTCDTWHVTCYTWHVTRDTWHLGGPSQAVWRGGPMRGLGSGHVTRGPMRGLEINYAGRGHAHTHTCPQTDIATLWLNRLSGPIQWKKHCIWFGLEPWISNMLYPHKKNCLNSFVKVSFETKYKEKPIYSCKPN